MRTFYDAGDGRMLAVEYDVLPEETSLRVNGIQMEPDYAATVEINSVMIEGVDVMDLLDPDLLADIEKEIRGGK
jgi:hypothetical protein